METTISYLAVVPPPSFLSPSSTATKVSFSIAITPPRTRTRTRTRTRRRRSRSSIQSIRASVGGTHRRRRTLSEGWDPSGISTGPAWLPRLEELDTTNMLLKQRIVFLGSQVDDVTADLIMSQLLFLDAEDQQKDIKLFINSPGGSVTAGHWMY